MHVVFYQRCRLLLEEAGRFGRAGSHLLLDLPNGVYLDALLVFISIAAAWTHFLSSGCLGGLLFGVVDLVVRSHEEIAFERHIRGFTPRGFFLGLYGEFEIALFNVEGWGGVDGGEFLAEGGGRLAIYALRGLFNFIHHLRRLHIIITHSTQRRAFI